MTAPWAAHALQEQALRAYDAPGPVPLRDRRRWLLGTALGAVAPFFNSACAQPSRLPASPLNVFPVAEAAFSATLWGLDAEGHVSLRTGDKLRVLAAEELAYYGQWHETETGPQILLTDGSCIRADLLALDDEQVVVGDASGVGRTRWARSVLPRTAVRGVLWQPPAGAEARDRLWQQIVQAPAPQDRLWLLGGSSLSGQLQPYTASIFSSRSTPAVGEEALALLRPENEQVITISLDKVRAVRLQDASSTERPAEPTFKPNPLRSKEFWIGMQDGSLLRVREIQARRDPVRLLLAGGGMLLLPAGPDGERSFWSQVTYLEPVHARLTWLSDLEPVGYKHVPFVGVDRPLGRDGNVLGGRLRTFDAVYRKGLGMPSASRVAYEIVGYRRFQSELAVDAITGWQGSVVFKVFRQSPDGTWELASESPPVRGGDAPLPITVDCRGATRLALLVDYAEWANRGDVANWLMARLVR